MDLGIQGKNALVTGASSGLGFATARTLAAEGARVVIVSRSKDNIEKAASAIHADSGADVAPLTADLADTDTIPELVHRAAEAFGPISVLVANAGGPPAGRFENLEADRFDVAYRLTLLSTVELCRGVLPGMKTAGWGRIVAITSTSVKQPIDGLLLSNTFRPGLTGFLKTLSREIGGFGITVNSVAPGYTDTERLAVLVAKTAKDRGISEDQVLVEWAKGTAVGRIGTPEEVAAAVAWLCSRQAGYISGTVLSVDGGRTAGLL